MISCYECGMLRLPRFLVRAALPSLLVALLAACGGSSSATSSTTSKDAGVADSGGAKKDTGTATAKEAGTTSGDAGAADAKTSASPDAMASGSPDAKAPAEGGSSRDAGFTPGAPITATPATWTWVPVEGAVCGNGSPTGIGVNLSSTPDARVLLYLEGGGACWNDLTCFTLMTASYFTTGYAESDFTAETSDATYLKLPGGFFDRTSATNPFKDYSYVYVPYCTGDIYGGDNVVQFPSGAANFVGWKDFGLYLDRIVPTFPSAPRVILAGSSAGGFGAGLNWSRTQAAFGSIRVDVIDDSGTPMSAAILAMGLSQSTIATPWALDGAFPAGCTTCDADLSTLLGYYDTAFPTHRAALLSYVQDSVLPTFYGITEAEFEMGLSQDLSSYFQPTDPFKSFTINQSGHVLFFSPQLSTSTGVTVEQFVTQMVTDDAAWTDEGP
jgi:hypothetical protein